MIDLNDIEPANGLHDLDDLAARLAACASSWVPRYFPKGRISDDRSELRLANIDGDAPRKTGSCVIGLSGEMAGCWKDFDGGDGGGPLSTLKHASGKDGRELFELAAEIVGGELTYKSTGPRIGGAGAGLKTHKAVTARAPKDPSAEIAHILARAVPIAGTLAETYLQSRGLTDPKSPDLLFCDNVTDWKAGVGRPAMIAIPRLGSGGSAGGIHRTFLAYDGRSKAPMDKPKKMLGDMENGAVRLAEMGEDGRLGVAEGIETALAASALYGLPVWAATAAPFMAGTDRTGQWIGFVPPPGCKALYIFADAGEAGMKVAKWLLEVATEHGLPAVIVEPVGGDDFNHDLQTGAGVRTIPDLLESPNENDSGTLASRESIDSDSVVLPQAVSPADLQIAISNLSKKSPPGDLEFVMAQIAIAQCDPLATRQLITNVHAKTGLKVKLLDNSINERRKANATMNGPKDGWMSRMILTDGGEPRILMENASTVFEMAPEFRDVLWFDEFAQRPMMRRPGPWDRLNGSFTERPWTDADDAEATRWLQRAGIPIPSIITHEAALATAHKNAYHPVREYLEGLEWDREPRLNFWGCDYLGAEDTPYIHAVCARWLISAVARVMRPGVQADHMLVLEGPQGIYKSGALRALFDPWFSDDPREMGTPEASIQLAGVWCLEYADLDRFGRADRNRLKSFITRRVDRYRSPYGRHAEDHPRQTVFSGTTNEGAYLDDPTGGRRIWPVQTPSPDPAGIAQARDQLWAEAVHRFEAGELFYLVEPELQAEASRQQRQRQNEESWGFKIRYVLDGGQIGGRLNTVTVHDILNGINLPTDRWNAASYNRIRDYLQFIGWTRQSDGDSNTFVRPAPKDD